jgi:rare lipoprotein A
VIARGAALALVVALAACGGSSTSARGTIPGEPGGDGAGATERGRASWYGARFDGRLTANGERFDRRELTAAHKRLRFGTRVRVTNLANGRTVEVRINDRGPYARGRVIDLSEAAAEALEMIDAGVVPVELEVLWVPARPERAR